MPRGSRECTVADQPVTYKKVTHFWKILEIPEKNLKDFIFEYSRGQKLFVFRMTENQTNGQVGWILLDFYSKMTQFIWKTSFQDQFFRNGCIKDQTEMSYRSGRFVSQKSIYPEKVLKKYPKISLMWHIFMNLVEHNLCYTRFVNFWSPIQWVPLHLVRTRSDHSKI